MKTTKNVTNILVNQANIARTGTIVDTALVPNNALVVGEMVITEPSGSTIDCTVRLPRFFKVMLRRTDGEYMASDVIDAANVLHYNRTAYAARAEKVAAWGYNPVTAAGSISVTPGTYKLDIQLNYASGSNWGVNHLTHATNVAPAAATQATIAFGIAKNAIENTKDKGDLLIERTNATVSVATSGGVVSVRKGSKYVYIVESAGGANDAGLYNADARTTAIGDYLRIVVGGVAVTGGVYRVAGITGAGTAACTIELDIPYQGASADVAAANAGVIAAAGLGNFGVRFTSVAPTFAPPAFGNDITDFVISDSSDDATTPLVISTAANLGVGTYRTVRQMEDEFNSNSIAYTGQPDIPFTYQSSATGTYDMYYIQWKTETEGVTSNDAALKELYIAANILGGAGASMTDANTGVQTTLAAYAAGTGYSWPV